MRSSALVAALLSVIAVAACGDKNAPPDAEFKPAAPPMQAPGGGDTAAAAEHAAVGDPSTETAAAGVQPDASPNTAAVGGTAPKPRGHGFGTISAIEGKPMIVRDTKPMNATVGSGLQPGDIIETGADTKVRINLDDGSVLAVGSRSKITLKSYVLEGQTRSGSIRVAIGSFWMNVSKWAVPEQSSVEVETPNAVAGVRGTTLWGDTQRGVICSLEGNVVVTSVSGKMKPASLTPGHCVGDLDANKLTPVTPDAATVTKYLDEVQIKQPK
jgi:hypothetical protein